MNASILMLLLLAALSSTAPGSNQAPTIRENVQTLRTDYVRIGDFGYYKLNETYVIWSQAWKTCISEGSHLLVLHSQEEYDAVETWLLQDTKFLAGYLLYGAQHSFENEILVTIFDEPVKDSGYNKWGLDFSDPVYNNNVDFPDVIMAIGDFGSFMVNKGLYLSRDDPQRFVCKINITP